MGSAFKSKSPDIELGPISTTSKQQKTLFVIPKNNIVTNKRDTKGRLEEEWKHSHEFSEENVREDDEVEDHQYNNINRIRESDS